MLNGTSRRFQVTKALKQFEVTINLMPCIHMLLIKLFVLNVLKHVLLVHFVILGSLTRGTNG